MKPIHTLILAGATALSIGAFAGHAQAETIYTEVTPGATVTTVTPGTKVVNEEYRVIGTRKVGLVGYHPYPLRASSVESTTVHVPDTAHVVYAPANVSTSTSVSTYTTTGEPVSYTTGGGNYYTENGVRYYRDPALNIDVRSTGSFND